jgi:pimeloyl-ACP methyl ester carboxylesterase
LNAAKGFTGAAMSQVDSDTPRIPRHGSYRSLGLAGFHRIHYCDWGAPDNPHVVVCAHGHGRNARDFDSIARELAADFRVICPDLAARGEGDWLGTSMAYGPAQMLTDLNVLLSRLDGRQVDWIGTSLGGELGQLLAAQPGTPVRRLVLHDLGDSEPQSFLGVAGGSSGNLRNAGQRAICPTLVTSIWDIPAMRDFLRADSAPVANDPWARRSA